MPRILRHGRPGHRRSASSPSLTAASLISKSLRSTAAIVFKSSRNASKSIPRTNCTIISMPSRMSRSESAGSLKGKDRLARGFGGNCLLEIFFRGKIYASTQHLSKATFDSYHVQEREAASGRELGYDIHVRYLADSRPPCVRAVQKQMLDTGGFEFAFVLAQFSDDRGPVHAAALQVFSRIFTQPRKLTMFIAYRRLSRPMRLEEGMNLAHCQGVFAPWVLSKGTCSLRPLVLASRTQWRRCIGALDLLRQHQD